MVPDKLISAEPSKVPHNIRHVIAPPPSAHHSRTKVDEFLHPMKLDRSMGAIQRDTVSDGGQHQRTDNLNEGISW